MAVADMFLKLQGVTGESADASHKGEIDVVSWSWGMDAAKGEAVGGEHVVAGVPTLTEVEVVKRVDQSTPTLMGFVWMNKDFKAKLTVRKAGQTPLEYFTIELENARITSVHLESQASELMERVRLGFSRVTVTYVTQQASGVRGAGTTFTADAHTAMA